MRDFTKIETRIDWLEEEDKNITSWIKMIEKDIHSTYPKIEELKKESDNHLLQINELTQQGNELSKRLKHLENNFKLSQQNK